jgi:hypothetical protein
MLDVSTSYVNCIITKLWRESYTDTSFVTSSCSASINAACAQFAMKVMSVLAAVSMNRDSCRPPFAVSIKIIVFTTAGQSWVGLLYE